MTIRQVEAPEKKARICNDVLRALPSWFGVEASIVDYVEKTQGMPFWAAFDGDAPVGFVALKAHTPYAAEVCVMGVLRAYHRQGIGKALIKCCEAHCIERTMAYLTVKTLDESGESESYDKTRRFYMAMGFRPLEVFPLYWDADNPCLLMAKHLPERKEG